ncbi:50S ribosomal protein L25/general stress protein Ctc [Indiicoccus explosivorum]|uniref:50S ribosomal protein L25/general stress protein Ctc n=1 Tax=Indiicoccus explosivorum TaxID=1917864 RepID=UPI000B43CAF0|nr:50S ribosomal protein L25/general stress protein Ctc [Indiicoccus explosivorum]
MATVMNAKKRQSDVPHSALTELRQKGFVPGVVYGYQTETVPVSVEEVELIKTLRETGRNGVISLEVDGKQTNVVLNDYQMDALKGSFKHVDFLAINMTEDLEVDAPVHLTGEAKGVSEGGIINQPNHEVTLNVKPSDIPDAIEVDVTDLDIGDSLTVGDIRDKVPYEIVTEDNYVLANVLAPRVEEEEEPEAEEGEEPEAADADSEETADGQGETEAEGEETENQE